MKKGSWIVNTARGALVVAEDMAAALESGHIRGYGGDVWNVVRSTFFRLLPFLLSLLPSFLDPLLAFFVLLLDNDHVHHQAAN